MTQNRKKQWVEALMTKRHAIAGALGVPLGEMLGCGHWGCVFESVSPWVVKFSIDPTEGPIWSKIGGILADEAYGADGFVELKSITRLTPDLRVGGKNRKVWAIVREAVEPVFREYSQKELGKRGHGTTLMTSGVTTALLDLPGPESPFGLRRGTDKQKDFSDGIDGLFDYRELATLWHLLGKSRLGSVERSRLGAMRSRYGMDSQDDVEEAIDRVLGHLRGPLMGPLGESLVMLASNRIFLRDVHNMNIGWHLPRSDDDWAKVVVFDPGHTPTDKMEIETVLLENPREAL